MGNIHIHNTKHQAPLPRTRIAYEVETGGVVTQIELPLIIGILADLSAASGSSLPPLNERKMIEIDHDNIDSVMAELAPDIDAPVFRAVKKTWHDLQRLVSSVEAGPMIKLRVLNVLKDELRSDLAQAPDYDQSALFKLVYEAEYGTFGGAPYSVLVSDYAFGDGANDCALLKKIAEVAGASSALFIASAVAGPVDIQNGDARFLALVPAPEKEVAATDLQCVSINPAYVLTQDIAKAFSLNGWAPVTAGVTDTLRPPLLSMLLVLRFMQTIKLVMREKVGSFLTRANVEAYLNTWIAQYVLLDDEATTELKTIYPLCKAGIVVTEVPDSPGSYAATAFLAPHPQPGAQASSIRLVGQLPK